MFNCAQFLNFKIFRIRFDFADQVAVILQDILAPDIKRQKRRAVEDHLAAGVDQQSGEEGEDQEGDLFLTLLHNLNFKEHDMYLHIFYC